VIDSFGDGTDPGTEWGPDDGGGTADDDLRRRCPATARPHALSPFDPAAAGWDAFGVDALGDLGHYACANQ